jgi:hypothetical protein
MPAMPTTIVQKDDRRDDHFDQLDEAIAERLHGLAGLGEKVTEQNADDDRDDYLEVQRFVERFLACCRYFCCHFLPLRLRP